MIATPVYGAPALLVKIGRERTLVVADLHLGIESELARRGVSLPSQIHKVKERLLKLVKQQKPNRLIFLGDLKHNIPIVSWQEWREIPAFLTDLMKLLPVEIVRGNHDGDLKGIVPKRVIIHDARGVVLGKRREVGLMHGHAWPSPELLNTKLLITAHNHPAVEFRDKLGGRTIEPIWLRAELDVSKFPKKLRKHINKLPELFVMPAFSGLVRGAAVNREMPKELIGPMFKAGSVKLDDAEAYLLDGTFLGKISKLR